MIGSTETAVSRDYGRRDPPVWGFLGVVIVWLAIVILLGLACSTQLDLHDGRLLTVHDLAWKYLVPLSVGFVFVYAVIGALGWWRPLFYDPKPVRPWVSVVPLIWVVASMAGMNYSALGDRGSGYTIALFVAVMLIGFGEEGMFRCIGVTSMRRAGCSRARLRCGRR